MAQVHKLGVNFVEECGEDHIDRTVAFAEHTIWLKYPELVARAKHGDIVEGASAGYRTNGIYFVVKDPDFRLVPPCFDFGDWGNVPDEIEVFVDVPYDHYDLRKMKVVEYDAGAKHKFYWYSEGQSPCANLSTSLRYDNQWYASPDEHRIILKFGGDLYDFEHASNEDNEPPTWIDLSLVRKFVREDK